MWSTSFEPANENGSIFPYSAMLDGGGFTSADKLLDGESTKMLVSFASATKRLLSC